MTRYSQVWEDKWFDLDWLNNQTACCDCGLVHDEDYRIVGGKLQCRSRRDNRRTAAVRRERRKRNARQVDLLDTLGL